MNRRIASLILVVMSMFTVVGSNAGVAGAGLAAVTVYPPGASLTVVTDKQVYASGQPVVITVRHCAPGSTITVTVNQPGGNAPLVLTAVTDASGNASVTMIASGPGATTVTARCGTIVSTTRFSVSGRAVPNAGTDTRSTALAAAILVVVGAGLLFVAKKRRNDNESDESGDLSAVVHA